MERDRILIDLADSGSVPAVADFLIKPLDGVAVFRSANGRSWTLHDRPPFSGRPSLTVESRCGAVVVG
jgi:hypothetical protein